MASEVGVQAFGWRRLLIVGLCALAMWTSWPDRADATPDSRRFISVNVFKDRVPAAGAYLEMYRNGRRIAWGTANGDGTYRFGNLDFGDYEVRAVYRQGSKTYRGSAIGKVTGTHMHVFRIHLQR